MICVLAQNDTVSLAKQKYRNLVELLALASLVIVVALILNFRRIQQKMVPCQYVSLLDFGSSSE